MKKIFIIFFSLITIISSGYGLEIDERVTDVYFGNGVWNDINGAKEGQKELQKFIKINLNQDIKVKLAFNHTYGGRRDLIETFYQLAQLGQISAGYFVTLSNIMTPDIPSVLLSQYISGVISEEAGDLNTIVQSYKNEINNGHKVLLVSHSQGNLFGLRAYDALQNWQKEYFLQLSVATPGSRVASYGDWVTDSNDLVIKQVLDLAIVGINSLPANATNVEELSDISGHEFVSIYLSGIDTSTKIKNALVNSFDMLSNIQTQWQTKQEAGCGCNKYIEVEHRYDANLNKVMKDKKVLPFAPNQKLYPLDGKLVKASAGGISIQAGGGGICYTLEGTGEIITGQAIPEPIDGTIQVFLDWQSKNINLDISVEYKNEDGSTTVEDVGEVDLESNDIECYKEHWYINEEDISKGDYIISINSKEEVDESLLPENVHFKVEAPGTSVEFTLPIINASDLNMGEVALVHVTKPDGGGSISLSPETTKIPNLKVEVKHYDKEGNVYNYEAISLLPTAEHGALADASYSVSPLLDPDNILYTGITSSSPDMQSNGLMLLPTSLKEQVTDDALYLISVKGGRDVDANDDLILDTIATTNLGNIHSLVYGSEIKEGKIKTNILTELSYQIFSHSNEDNLTKIKNTLTKVAKKLLREDLNGDKEINYADLHAWVPSFDKPKLLISYDDKIDPIVQKSYKDEDIYLDAYTLLFAGDTLDGLEVDNSSESDYIKLYFNSLVDTSTLNNDSFTLIDSNGNNINVYITITDGEVVFSFDEKLNVGETYTLKYSLEVKDALGNIYIDTYVHEILIPDIVAPEISTSGTIHIDENKAIVAIITAKDDSEDTLTYSITSGLDADVFVFNNNNELSFLEASNYEKPLDTNEDNVYEVEITVTDTSSNASSLSLQVVVNNLPEKPELESISFEVNEDTQIGIYIGSVPIVNEGDGEIQSFENKNTKEFEIDAEGKIYTKLAFDFEKKDRYSFYTKMYTTAGLSNNVKIEVNIIDIQEFVPQVHNFTGSMYSGAKEGTPLGKLYVYEGQDKVSMIELLGAGASDFIVDENGSIRVSSSANLDDTIKSQYNLKAIATNSYGLSEEANLTIYINTYSKQYGTDGNEVIEDILVDDVDNVFVTGSTSGLLEGDTSDKYNDAFVSKLDANGQLLWTKQFGQNYATESKSIALDSQGNIYIAGNQKTDKVGDYYRSAVWITALSSDGSLLWTKSLDSGANSYEEAIKILIDKNDDLYVIGDSSGSFEGTFNKGSDDIFMTKLDRFGQTLWVELFGTFDNDHATSATISQNEHVIISGTSQGTFSGAIQEGLKGMFLMNISLEGEANWIHQFGTENMDYLELNAVTVDNNDNIYTVGYYQSYSKNRYFQFVEKYDVNGLRLWKNVKEYSSFVFPQDIVVSDEGIYLSGYTYGSMDENTNKTDYLYQYEKADIYLIKYNLEGKRLYTKQYGTKEWDESHAIALDKENHLYIGGYVSESFEGHESLAGDDSWLMKITR